MATTNKRFVAKNGLDNNNQTITNIGAAGTSLGLSGTGDLTIAISGTATLTIPSGSDTLVTLSGAQTLTNKTISGSNNTISNIGNSSLTNSSVSFNGVTVSLGASGTLYTDDISEDGSPTNKYFTDARARAAISVTDASGDGSLSYDSGTGVITYTGPSATEVRAHLSAGTGLTYTSGQFAIDSTVVTLTGTQTLENKTLTTPVISAITNTGTLTLPTSTDTLVGRATADTLSNKTISGTSNTLSNIGNGSLTNSSITINGTSVSLGGTRTLVTDDIAEDGSPVNLWYTDTRARNAISVTDAGGDGSLSYSSGVITYTGPSASEVRAHFSAGTGVTITSGQVAIGQAVATTDNVTFAGVTADNVRVGVTAAGEIDTSTGNLTIDSAGGTTTIDDNATVTGNLQVDGNLTVSGTTVTINATNLAIEDNMIYLNNGSAVTNPDLGIAGNYNDGTYRHAGLFRDATDGVWKFFHQYTPEPDASAYIDTSHGSFALAPIQASSFTGSVTGNASTATTWQTARTLSLTGDVTGTSAAFDGSGNISISTTIAADSVALGTDTTGNYVASITNGNYITGGNSGSEGAALTLAVDATSANTASKVVARDASGNFSAGTITATLSGNASSVTNGVYTTDTGTVTNTMLAGSIANNKLANSTISGISLGGNLATLTLGVSGTGLSGSQTYNGSSAATFTVTSNATSTNTASTIVARDASGNFTAGTITAALSGNATTATTLQTARNINGVSFDGSGNITVTAAAGTLTGDTLASGVTTSSLTSVGTLTSLTVSGNLTVDTSTLKVDSANNRVGIGTATPFTLFHVKAATNKSLIVQDAGIADTIEISNYDTADGLRPILMSASTLLFGTGTAGGGSTTTRLTIDASGNLAVDTNTLYVDATNNRVGVGTTSPQKNLEVIVPANDFASVGVNQISVGEWAGIHFGYREANTFYRKSAIVFERTDLTASDAQGKVHILNGPQGSGGSATLADARLTIGESGHVGISATTPAARLDVRGGEVWVRSSTSDSVPRLKLIGNSSSGDGEIDGGIGGYGLLFKTNGSEGMRLDSSNRLQLGITNGSYKLNVKTAAQVGISIQTGSSTFGSPALNLYDTSTGVDACITAVSGAFAMGSYSSTPLAFYMGNGEAARFDTSRRFLIGTTTDPTTGGFTSTRVLIKQMTDGTGGGGLHIEQSSNTNVAYFGFTGSAFRIGTSYRSTGSYQPIEFYAGPTVASSMILSTGGNLGIGTASPIRTLQVNGTTQFGNVTGSASGDAFVFANTGYNQMNITHNTSWGLLVGYGDGSVSGGYHGTNHAALINVQNAPLHLGTHNTPRLTILGNGAVGIGTTGATSLLNVNGSGTTGYDSASGAAIVTVGALNNYPAFQIALANTYNAQLRTYGNDLELFAGHWRTIGDVSSEDHSIRFYTSRAGSSDWSTAKMILNHNGNVGIGTTSPNAKFTVVGASADSSSDLIYTTGYNGKSFFSVHQLGFVRVRSSDINGAAVHYFENNGTKRMEMSVTSIGMQYYSDAIASTWLYLHNQGRIGINVVPDVALSVNGVVHIGNGGNFVYMGGTAGSSGSWGSRHYTSGGNNVNNANTFQFDNVGYGSTWTVTFNSSGITASGNITAYSDIRLKENIMKIENALDKVQQLRGITYTRNDTDDTTKRHAGVIAQEVEQVLPEVVDETSSGIKHVAYGNMVGLLIEAIKELKKENELLTSRINKITGDAE